MKRILLWFWVVVLSGNALNGAISAKGDFLTMPITREKLARGLVHFSQAPIDARELHLWAERLEDKDPVKTDASFEKPLRVREIALAVLEASTGEAFSAVKSGKATPVKEIVVCQIGDTPWRFHIADLTEEEYEVVARNIHYWISGYEAGLKKHKQSRQ
jgi:hypothetical protein